MTDSAVISLAIAEISRFDRFRQAELESISAGAPELDEMIAVVLYERDRLERSARAAEAAYGGMFDARVVRHSAVLQRAAEFLGLIVQRKDEVRALLQSKPPQRRRSA